MKRRITFLTAAFVLLAFLAVPLGMRGQTRDVETFTFSELGYGNAEAVTTVEGTNVTLTFAQGTNANNAPMYYTTGTGVRMYTGNTLEVALNDQGSETRITAIDFTFAGTYTGSLQNWTGSETSVSFTNTSSGQARIQVIEVTFSEGGVAPVTYTVTYNANVAGVNPVVDTYNEGANVTLRPANTFTNAGHTFSEWNTQADGDGDPYDAGDVIENIQENLEFYAIWIEDTPSDEQWVLTNLADLTENDVFVIVGNNGSNYAMPNNNGTSSAPTAVAVTIANNEIIGTVDATIQWNISGDASNGYTFYPNGSTETWLYCTNSNNGVRVGTNTSKTFVVEEGYLKHSGTNRYVGIYNSQDWRCYTSMGGNIANQTFAFYKKVTGGIVPPSISAENVEIAYDATIGSIAYTINNSVDGGTLTAVTESDWLTLGQGTTSPISFTCPANEAGTERTATVTLTYTYNRATATANVTVTQAGNPNITQTIAEVRAQGTGAVVTQGTVTSITGSSNKTAYIQDATAAIVVYGNFSATVGDEIRVSGTLSDYNGLLEITSPQVTLISSGNSITPELMTVAEAAASTNQGWYIRIEEATVTNITGSGNSQNTSITQEGTTIVVRGNLGTTVAVNDIISLDGNIGYYNGNQIANPQNVEVQQILVPFITVTPATVNVDADLHAEGLAIAYENIEITSYQDFAVQFYDAEGEETDMPDWLVAMVTGVIGGDPDEYQLTCAIINNEGEARSAYMKVYAYDAENNVVYSNLVTVNQAEYVAPTYAELPFEFDGGKAAIDTIDGLYQEGLSSDYGSSPKLRFDNTGDWLLLQFQEVPGTLTFDIKGNSFSNGTFKVQTSEDGVTYTDLETYTNLTATVQSEEFNNLGENVRYIKWIYINKVSGNVALGNITLSQYTVLGTYDLTVEPFENLEIFTFIGGDENNPFEGAGTIQVTEGKNVMLSVSANEGYEIQSLMVDGVEHVNDIDDAETYTFVMPAHNVTVSATAAPVVPFEPATYTLATTIESGKTYIIVGVKETDSVTNYYAMGEQRNNNRGGYAISVDGTTATVETADVHEFVITALDQPGFYSIYDNGYLYAASNNSNHLKTLDTLNVNGEWEISINDTTGWFSVVASNSSNRNVMQFNGMGSNALFSCYGTASQSPVYLYVKDEVPSTVTQTVALSSEAVNYCSFYVDITLSDLQTALTDVLGNGSSVSITIKSQTQSCKLTRGRWTGQLQTLDLGKMYLISVNSDCEITLEGMLVDPADHPITIAGAGSPTWIAFPFNADMTLTNAFNGFAVNGDAVKSKTLNANYIRGRWTGQLSELEPGQGYIYKSATNTSDRVFIYPTSKK